jgi:alkanesulfonate monooxygenase SsuD/methylene tetrahydromethanopterin reductase-like flavin-dependent oxidoreductase (luciferase family)
VCVGGSGERRTLRTAARFAQHWNFVGGTPEEFARKRDVLHAHCQDIGRDPREITLSSHIRLDPGGDARPGREATYVARGQKQARGGKDFLAPPTAKKIAQVQRIYKMLPYLPVKHLMKYLTTRTATGINLPEY